MLLVAREDIHQQQWFQAVLIREVDGHQNRRDNGGWEGGDYTVPAGQAQISLLVYIKGGSVRRIRDNIRKDTQSASTGRAVQSGMDRDTSSGFVANAGGQEQVSQERALSGPVSSEAGLLGISVEAGCREQEREVRSGNGQSEVGADDDQIGRAESVDSEGDDQTMRKEISGRRATWRTHSASSWVGVMNCFIVQVGRVFIQREIYSIILKKPINGNWISPP
jgi:hypothetical protein